MTQYLFDSRIDLNKYNGIELVIVAHHNSAERLIEFVMPSTHAQFKEIQFVNSEVVRLPGQCLQNFVKKIPTNELMVRIFPLNFNKNLSRTNVQNKTLIETIKLLENHIKIL